MERVPIRRATTTKQKADAVFVLHDAVTVQLAQSLKSEGFTFIALHPGAAHVGPCPLSRIAVSLLRDLASVRRRKSLPECLHLCQLMP